MNRWHESTHPTAQDLWFTSRWARGFTPRPIFTHHTPFFFLHNQDGGDGGNAQTCDRYPDSTSHLLNTVYVWGINVHISSFLLQSAVQVTFIWCFELLESNFDITATPLCSICFNKSSFVVFFLFQRQLSSICVKNTLRVEPEIMKWD